MRIERIGSVSLLCALAGCAVGPQYAPPKPAVPQAWTSTGIRKSPHAQSVVDPQAPQVDAWWTTFNDPALVSLVSRCAAQNLDVREAVLRIDEARANRAVTAAGLWPSVSADAQFTRQRLSENTPNGAIFGVASSIPGLPSGVIFKNPYNQFQASLALSWEIDLFGRVRRSVEASDADTQAAVEAGRDVLVSLAAEVADAYIDLRGAQLRRSVVEASLATERDLLDLTRQRRDAGLTTDLDVANASTEVSTSAAQLPPLERQISSDINELSRLMEREPDALRAELDQAQPVPPVPPTVAIGLPAELARRRPDIRRAESNLHAATARIGVAVADLFPRLTLTGSGGYQSEQLSDLVRTASRFGSVGPSLDLPIFDAGKRRATVRLQNVRAQEAAIDYARAVLGALHEVENALVAYRSDQDRRVALEASVDSSRDALMLARDRYQSGVTSFIDVLDAERTLQQNELALAETTSSVSTDLVQLYKALGGGWEQRSD
jgi:multidrug efflux system outer membrane protein